MFSPGDELLGWLLVVAVMLVVGVVTSLVMNGLFCVLEHH